MFGWQAEVVGGFWPDYHGKMTIVKYKIINSKNFALTQLSSFL